MKQWHPSPPDERDWPLSALPVPAEKPNFASLRHYIKEVLDQKDAPICVAATFCAAFQAVYGIKFSMRWFYWQCKKIDGIPGDGTTFRAALQVATKQGCCPEEFCPTFPDWRNQDFTEEMAQEAAKHKIKSYARLNVGTLEEVEKAIAAGYFVPMGTIVDSVEWMDDEYLLEPEGSWLGGHATLGIEFDEAMLYQGYKDFLVFLNSWGTEKGRKGYYYMAEKYASATSADLPGWHPLTEAWAIEFDQKLIPKLREGDTLLVGIDPGHGGEPGAIGPSGTAEKDITLPVSLELDKALKRNGIPTVMTRTEDKTVSLTERSNLLNAKGCTLAVSVHINSSTSRSADYISTFVYRKGGAAEKCAALVQKEIVNVTGWEDGGVCEGNLHMLRETSMPAILIEAGFISNPSQEVWLQQPDNQKKLAEAICKGICTYLGKLYKEEIKVDKPSNWAKKAWEWGVREGITDGTNPKENITREQVVLMLYRLKGGK